MVLNQPAVDADTGLEYRDNDVQRTMLKVTLEHVPSTPSFRAQQLSAMSEAFKSMPQRYQEATLPFLFALMDVPNKKEVLDVVKSLANVPTEEEIQKRIEAAVIAKGLEIRSREADIKDRLTEAQVQKIVADSVAKTIEGIYSATQAGMQISQVPGVAPIADQLLRSAGFQDRDAPPIVAPGTAMPGAVGMVDAPPAPVVPEEFQPQQNTSPMFPPRANPEQIPAPGIDQQQPIEQADEGMNYGIEAEGVQ